MRIFSQNYYDFNFNFMDGDHKDLLIDSDGHLDDFKVHVYEERIYFELKLGF